MRVHVEAGSRWVQALRRSLLEDELEEEEGAERKKATLQATHHAAQQGRGGCERVGVPHSQAAADRHDTTSAVDVDKKRADLEHAGERTRGS